jgi:hypothetical protein
MARQVYVPPLRATVTKFNVAIGHCHDCGRRGCREPIPSRPPTLWARRPRGSAGAAKAWAMWLHYSLGLSFGKTRQGLGPSRVNVTAGGLPGSESSPSTQ